MTNKIRFSDAAAAIEATPKALRKMLQNPAMILPGVQQEGWQEFSQVQLAALSISRRLIEFGFSVGDASEMALLIIFRILPDRNEATWSEAPPLNAREFIGLFADQHAVAWFDGGVRKTDIVRTKAVTEAVKSGACSSLFVPLGPTVSRCFDRAGVLADDDMTGADSAAVESISKIMVDSHRRSQR